MSKVDWSQAPEGAEFYAGGYFWKRNAGMSGFTNPFLLFSDIDWIPAGKGFDPLKMPNHEYRPTEWPSEQRIEQIGQNGGTGEHYNATESAQSDLINNPKHYQLIGGLEAIGVIERTLTPEQFKGYLIGNFLKYRLRQGRKDDATQDLAKSEWYRQRAEGL